MLNKLNNRHLKIFKWFLIFGLIISFIWIYRLYNPYEVKYYPKCSFRELTGYKCPGCGSQRAVHYLLNFQIIKAAKENFLLVFMLPYLVLLFLTDFKIIKNEKIKKFFTGIPFLTAIFILIILFWIVRNIPYFNNLLGIN